jgi:hypothetical protein
LLYFRAAAGGRLILDSLQPTGASPEPTKKDAPFLPHIARACEPLPLDEPDTGSASEPPPDGPEGLPLELGETGALAGEEGVSGAVPEGVLGVAGEGGVSGVVPEGALGVAGGVGSGAAPEGAPGAAGGAASGIPPPGALGELPGGVTGEGFGEVGVASVGCA